MHLRASRIPRAQTAAARFTPRKSRCDISRSPPSGGLTAARWVAGRACPCSPMSDPGSPAWPGPRRIVIPMARNARSAASWRPWAPTRLSPGPWPSDPADPPRASRRSRHERRSAVRHGDPQAEQADHQGSGHKPAARAVHGVRGPGGQAELKEEVRGHGARKAIGELVTCPFCLDLWVATGLMAGYIYLPRATRLAVDTLAVLSGADLLQFALRRCRSRSSPSSGRRVPRQPGAVPAAAAGKPPGRCRTMRLPKPDRQSRAQSLRCRRPGRRAAGEHSDRSRTEWNSCARPPVASRSVRFWAEVTLPAPARHRPAARPAGRPR